MADLAILLATYGEPTRNTFRDQWMYSYRILRRLTRKIARIPGPVLPLIATRRAIDRVAMWRERDFTSPLEPLTDRTVEALQAELGRRGMTGGDVEVSRFYEFRRPLMADVLPELRERGATRFLVVPMYMGGGDFTDGMTRLAIEDALAAHRWLEPGAIEMCLPYGDPAAVEALADALTDVVLAECAERGIELPARDWAVCLGAHGSVQTPEPGVDNGVASFGELLWALHTRLRDRFGRVRNGWLNHVKGGRWTEPSVERTLARLRGAGYDKLLYVPWGFCTDNAESALEGRVMCEELDPPFERLEYLPCMNDAPQLVRLIADRVEAHLGVGAGV